MTWTKPVDPAAVVGLADATPAKPLDAYLVWAQLNGFASLSATDRLGPIANDGSVSVLCEARSFDDVVELIRREASWLTIPARYGQVPRGGTGGARHFTARLERQHLTRLNALAALVRWELGLASVPNDAGRVRVDDPPPWVPFEVFAGGIRRPGTLGIIDHGLAFLNTQFRTPLATRITHLWDQGLPTFDPDPHWKKGEMGYGREARRALLSPLPPVRDELATYRQARYLQWSRDGLADLYALAGDTGQLPPTGSRDVLLHAHGTHVAHVAAGRSDPARLQLPADDAGDAASDAAIVFVQLPLLTALDSSGGSLAVHVLDGLRCILDQADPERPRVVNVSYGTNAGPHDGSSLIECAMDELCELVPENFVIVLGAGNGRMSRCHAREAVDPGETKRLVWRTYPGDVSDSFIEIWYDGTTSGSRQNVSLEIRITDPLGNPSDWVAAGAVSALAHRDVTVGALIHLRDSANGAGPMALLALRQSKTRRGGEHAPTSPAGDWTIELRAGKDSAPLLVDAWIERDDPPPGVESAQSIFLDSVSQSGTLSNLATGRYPIVAGARRLNGARYQLAFSGMGRTRGGQRRMPSPNVLAPSDEDDAHPGLLGSAVKSGTLVRMSGTSVAAPVLARRVFNEMVRRQAAGAAVDICEIDDLLSSLITGAAGPGPGRPPALPRPPANVAPNSQAPEPPSIVIRR